MGWAGLWACEFSASAIALAQANGARILDVRSGTLQPLADGLDRITGIAAGAAPGEWSITTTSARQNLLLSAGPKGPRTLWTSPQSISAPLLSPDKKNLSFAVTTTTSNAWLVEHF